MDSSTTVAVVAYRHAHYIAECLASVLQQSRPPEVVFVIDDNSPDETVAIARTYLAGHPLGERVHLICNSYNRGLNANLNTALRATQSAFFTYISADDLMSPRRIEVHEAILNGAPPDVFLAYSDAYVIDGASQITHLSSNEFPWPSEPDRTNHTQRCLVAGNWIPAASIFARTQQLRDAGGYHPKLFFEDYELLMRCAALSRFTYSQEPLVSVRRLSDSLGNVGFRQSSPRFIRATYEAYLSLENSPEEDLKKRGRALRWELAKRYAASGAPTRSSIMLMWQARSGAKSQLTAGYHITRAVTHGILHSKGKTAR